MVDASAIAERYIAVWNETDPELRRALLTKLWTESGTYVDPLMQGAGHEEIEALIGGVHRQFPGCRFALTGRPDGYGDRVRFSWELRQGGEVLVNGTDFGTLDQGRLKSVVGFLDQVPAAA
jgi:hypothetical protein